MRPLLAAAAIRTTQAALLAALFLAGCGGPDAPTEASSAPIPSPPAPVASGVPHNALEDLPLVTDPAAPPRHPDAEDLARLVEIPIQYRGRWIDPGLGCENNEETNVQIDAFHMVFYESVAIALAVTPVDESTVVFDLEERAEGLKWHRSQALKLSEDKMTMVDPSTEQSGYPFIRVRCTPIEEAPASPGQVESERPRGSLDGYYAISSIARVAVLPGEILQGTSSCQSVSTKPRVSRSCSTPMRPSSA